MALLQKFINLKSRDRGEAIEAVCSICDGQFEPARSVPEAQAHQMNRHRF